MFNRIYRLIWSQALQTWIAVSETTRGRGKQSGNLTAAARSVTAASLLLLSPLAQAGPEGGQVVSGSGSIRASGSNGQSTTTIKQASDKLSINWQSFNVGKAESVNFVQPSASALAVNRIFDTQGSQILGRINANGQVWLINPNGVIFGKDAQINVGGLLASTLNPDDASIGSARSNFSGSSTARVMNLGSINTAQGGYVAMLGHSVSNFGQISAPGGTVAMGAGSAVSLNFGGSKLLGLQVNSNQVGALAENGGLIQADGGQVLLSAGARESLLASVVNNTGIIQAHTVQEQEGKIVLLGGMAAGTTNVAGTLDASAPSGGNGGFIETSAYTVNVSDSAKITTASAQGTQGQWLIDPYDFYIAASGGNITGKALGDALTNNDVTIQTTDSGTSATGASATGGNSGNGDIFVNDTVSWSSGKTLTLDAWNNIYINSAINASGGTGGKLALLYGQASTTGGSANYAINAAVSLQAGANFSTKLGTSGTTTNYTVITSLGSAGDQSNTNVSATTNSLQGLGHSSRLNGKFVLGADIAAGGTSAWNSGSGFSPIGTFTGTLDGLGHIITGLTINRPMSTTAVGLFSVLNTGGVVRNVGLLNASVSGQNNVGSLVGRTNGGSISSSYATGNVTGGFYVGGLVGRNQNGSISNSSASVIVVANGKLTSGADLGKTFVGGLLGRNENGAITSSYATGNVTGNGGGSHVGGLVGSIDSGTMSNSYATGHVTGSGDYVGGLVGYNKINLSNSYATGNVIGINNIGGLVGRNESGNITSSYATGRVNGSGESVGGLVGEAVNGSISSSYAMGDVNGNGPFVGGLVGYNRIDISSSYAIGKVTGSSSYVGGLVGLRYQGTISGSYATGSVSGASGVGGLAGQSFNIGTITSSYATGSVNGSGENIGGLVGWNLGIISSSYAAGSVNGSSGNIGGLVGYNVAGLASISSSYAIGSVSGVNAIGGLVGQNNGGSISSSYFDKGTTGQTSGVGAGTATGVTGLSTSKMQRSENFSGFNFTSTWFNYDGYTAPLLRTFLTPLSVSYTVSGSKTYDGNTACGAITCSYTTGTLTSGKNLLGTASFVMSSKNAGTVTATGTGLYSDQQGYLMTASNSGTATIAKAPLTITGSSASTTYTGEVQTVSGYTVSGLVGSDTTSSLSGVSASVSGTNAGSYTNAVTASAQTNYTVSTANGSLTINKKALTVSGTTAAGKTYDGSTKAAINLGTLSGFAGSETVRATAIGNFDSRDAGVRSATATYTLADGTGLASNYQLADTTGLIAIIEKAPVEYLNGGGDNNYAASWVRFQNEKTSPVLWPQMTNGAVPAVEIRSPGVRLPDSALVIDLPALAAVNTP